MSASLFGVFLDVIVPVFGVVGVGYFLGPKVKVEARTLSRAAFYFFVPAFVFDVVSRIDLHLEQSMRMVAYVLVTCGLFGVLGYLAARLLRASREMTAAFVMTAIFGNVGNFGLALVNFRFGPPGLVPATLFFVIINVVAFGSVVVTAAWARGHTGLRPLLAIFKTPGLVAIIPALFVSATGVALPDTVTRMVGLLSQAMIPVMLMALGVQLAETDGFRFGGKEILAAAIRLVAAPMIAWPLIGFFGLDGLDRAAGIVQSSMPVAVLVSIVAIEYEVAPAFVTSTVFLSTILSLPTLTLILALV